MAKSLDRLFPFKSLNRVGDGAEETIAHGLSSTPDFVWVFMNDSTDEYSISTAADASNVYVTVDNTAVYDIVAGFMDPES